MTSFGFGTATPQQPQPSSLFGNPIAASTPMPNFGTGTSAPTGTVAPLFGGGQTGSAPTAVATPGFSFSNPSAPTAGTGFSFGTTPSVSTAPNPTIAPSSISGSVVPTSVQSISGGLGGIPSSGRLASLVLGGESWMTRTDNRALKELMVPPEIVAAVEELKNQMKNERAKLAEVQRFSDLEIDSVAEQIEDVRATVTSLTILMHKQEVHSASLVADLREIEKDMTTLAQVRECSVTDSESLSMPVSFLHNLADKYSNRLTLYKSEFERAEFSLKCMLGDQGNNAPDLWSALTASKDAVILLSSQLQQLQEDLRNQLATHKTICQVVYASTPKPWLTNAMSGSGESKATPLEKIWQTPGITQAASTAATSKVWSTPVAAAPSTANSSVKVWQTPTAPAPPPSTSNITLFKRPAPASTSPFK